MAGIRAFEGGQQWYVHVQEVRAALASQEASLRQRDTLLAERSAKVDALQVQGHSFTSYTRGCHCGNSALLWESMLGAVKLELDLVIAHCIGWRQQ